MAKKKQLIRNTIKSFVERHTDPENRDKLEATRKDMEEKKNQILHIVQNEEDNDESKRGLLAELIKDFHKQYESIYAQYDHLAGELKNKVHKHHRENGNSSSSLDSDSDSDSSSDSDISPKKKGSKRGKLKDETLKATNGLQQELEAAKGEVALLKHKLEAVSNENETLQSAYDAMISKLESAERTVTDLKVETDALNSEKSGLLAEKEDLSSKLEGSVKTEVDLRQQIEELIRDKDNLAVEKEDVENLKAETSEQIKALEEQNSSLKHDLDTLMREKREIEERFESTGTDAGKMAQEISELKVLLKEREEQISSLRNKLEINENESTFKIEALTAQVNDFTQEIDRLHAEKCRLEEQMNELKDDLNHKSEQYEKLEGSLQESWANLEAARSEIEKLTKELTVASEWKDDSIDQLKRTIEDLKRDVVVAEDEAKAALEKTRTIEFLVLMAKQKLRITEQLLAEKEEDYKIAVIRFQEECKLLEDKNTRLSIALTANNEVYRGTIKNISENMNRSVAGLECIIKKFEEDNQRFSGRIYSMSEEIHNLTHCVPGKNITTEKLEQLRNLTEELQNEREHGLMVKENLSKLEVEAEKEKGEKKRLLEALSELRKTTDEQVAILEQEKREAIRQMCLWSDNLQSRYNELKNLVMKSSTPKTLE